MTIRVLIVEDYESWRRYVSALLQNHPGYEVIGEVADGLEAVQAVARLKPDLVVMDIGLPTLNGIDAARRIRKAAPDLRILFLTEQGSSDIARAALATGAMGYVLKSDAGEELVPALEAISQGKQFVGARFAKDLVEGTKR